jgi:protein-S-isoprenylcysteine O-methyltransferase Ste14
VSIPAVAEIIVAVFGSLLVLWILTLLPARRAFAGQPAVPAPPTVTRSHNPRSFAAAVGTLAVFIVNILTLGLFVVAAFNPEARPFVETLRTPLPREAHWAGALLFAGYGIWGWLVLAFNPGYTPFFRKRTGAIVLAVRGPYAIIRHPRYAAEAALNVILFLFTGSWTSLLGVLAWPLIRRQAIREEEFLLGAAPETYGRYMAVTGRFLPRWKFRKADRPAA